MHLISLCWKITSHLLPLNVFIAERDVVLEWCVTVKIKLHDIKQSLSFCLDMHEVSIYIFTRKHLWLYTYILHSLYWHQYCLMSPHSFTIYIWLYTTIQYSAEGCPQHFSHLTVNSLSHISLVPMSCTSPCPRQCDVCHTHGHVTTTSTPVSTWCWINCT